MPERSGNGRGALFKNDRKTKDTQPDYKGEATVGNEDYWLAAWINESEKGTKYMSLSFTPKDEK